MKIFFEYLDRYYPGSSPVDLMFDRQKNPKCVCPNALELFANAFEQSVKDPVLAPIYKDIDLYHKACLDAVIDQMRDLIMIDFMSAYTDDEFSVLLSSLRLGNVESIDLGGTVRLPVRDLPDLREECKSGFPYLEEILGRKYRLTIS